MDKVRAKSKLLKEGRSKSAVERTAEGGIKKSR